MNPISQPWQSILSWIVTILVPVSLVIAAVRLIMTPAFLQIEYRTPNFPEDLYGFTLEDRLYWSRISADVLAKGRDLAYVQSLTFEDGTPLYNERELAHWDDVINLWRTVQRVWLVGLALLAVLGVWAWRGGWWEGFRFSLGRGGLLTVLLMGAVLVFAVAAFGVIFTGFHQLFFPPGTWTFPFSDTFIRLFPQRFWQDTFLAIGLLSGGAGLLLWYFLVRRV